MRLILPCIAALLLSGCIARTVVGVVTLPVKVAGSAVDAVTTSQAEADQKRGREARKAEERAEKDAKRARKQARRDAEDARE
jgi:hypothetical protein